MSDNERIERIAKKLDRIRDHMPTRWAHIIHRGSGAELVELSEDDPDGTWLAEQQCSGIPVYANVTPTPEEIAKWRANYEAELAYNTSYQDQRFLLEQLYERMKG